MTDIDPDRELVTIRNEITKALDSEDEEAKPSAAVVFRPGFRLIAFVFRTMIERTELERQKVEALRRIADAAEERLALAKRLP